MPNNPPLVNPLSDEHCDHCNALLQSIPATRDLIGRCKAVGIDCSKAEAYLAEQERTARQIKAQFFPHKP